MIVKERITIGDDLLHFLHYTGNGIQKDVQPFRTYFAQYCGFHCFLLFFTAFFIIFGRCFILKHVAKINEIFRLCKYKNKKNHP